MFKARLLQSKHIGDNGEEYIAGDVIESKVDLIKIFGPEKFGYVPPTEPVTPREKLPVGVTLEPLKSPQEPKGKRPRTSKSQLETLESMSVEQLIKFAEAEEIDLGSAKKKEDILKVIAG